MLCKRPASALAWQARAELATWLAVSLLTPVAVRAAGAEGGAHAAAGRGASPASAPIIETRPRRVHTGALVILALRDGTAAGGGLRWIASGGTLLYDDLPEVEWRAPDAPGPVTLTVALHSATQPPEGSAGPAATGVLEVKAQVDVEAPSIEGMIWVPPGPFIRGDVRGTRNVEEAKTVQNSSDEPVTLVDLSGYWIDRTMVTNRQYADFLQACVGEGMARVEEVAVMGEFEGAWVPFYYFQPYERLIAYYYDTRNARRPEFLHRLRFESGRFEVEPGHEERPVVDVSWFGAAAYARYHGKSLPSEAQWEKAARGVDGRRFPWGENVPSAYHVGLNDAAGRDLSPVGCFSPVGDGPYGGADMLAGCFEWTNDWFNIEYYGDTASDTPDRDPMGPFWGESHTIRGFPSALRFPQVSLEDSEPVSTRYSWRFEFLIGDAFANRTTSFRTVAAGVPGDGRTAGSEAVAAFAHP